MVEKSNLRERTPARGRPPIHLAGTLLAVAAFTAVLPAAAAEERSGGDIVKAQCSRCHAAGVAGAPRIGDKPAWVPRLNRGVDSLVGIAIRGHGGMPPRGGRADLTDAELRSALLYMFDPSGPPKDVPRTASAAPVAEPHRASVGGLDVYFGLVAASHMRELPAGSPESRMHGGVPAGAGYYHVNVSLFDSATQAQVTGAAVDLDVEQVGMGRERKRLEPMIVRGGSSYGTYVRLMPKASYVFVVHAAKAGSPRAVEAKFQERVN